MGEGNGEKTEMEQAWHNFVIAFGKSLRLDKLLDWMAERLNRIK